ncbi:MAG: nickel pincer cofactor biosynthesis protein LarC [Anaerotruncus sp.]|nr:nickel pincer cofactor biosynthesis protein LarC [Anaerotruncus sp.]
MKTLYFECYSGISGDMTVAALLDLGASEQKLHAALDSLGIDGYHIHTGRVDKCGISAYDFDVHLHDHEHPHEHDHEHPHDHEHRNLLDILEIINHAKIPEHAKQIAREIFGHVACAEAKVHGKPIEQVHFHEVGAIDSIIDVIGTAVCVDDLNVDRICCTPLYEGTGTVTCQHGVMPVPAPATAEIISAGGLKLRITDNVGEMVTPTGAAIAAALCKGMPPKSFRLLKTGYGAGKKDFPRANILRAHLIEEDTSQDEVLKLECNIDDMSGEQLSFAMERLFELGALDCWFTPIQMKKNRPAVLLSVLCRPEQGQSLTECLLQHTSTIGVRSSSMQRTVMERYPDVVQTPYGEVDVKRCRYHGIEKFFVEYESARACALRYGVPIYQIYRACED